MPTTTVQVHVELATGRTLVTNPIEPSRAARIHSDVVNAVGNPEGFSWVEFPNGDTLHTLAARFIVDTWKTMQTISGDVLDGGRP